MNSRSVLKQLTRPAGLLALLLLTLLVPVSFAYGSYQPTQADDVDGPISLLTSHEANEANNVSTSTQLVPFQVSEIQLITDTSQINPNTQVGHSVSISGTLAIVGTPYDNVNGTQSGSATIYGWNGSAWQEEAKLVPGDGRWRDQFGYSVSISGDVAIVGAWRAYSNRYHSGAAYIYRKSGETWILENKITATDGAYGDHFGYSVSIHGDLALVGALRDDNHGSAYIFSWNGQDWIQESKLAASGLSTNANFGHSVSLNGNTALVGAVGDNTNTGAAYVFRKNGSNWQQERRLIASDAATGDYFGNSVSLSGDVALIGAPYDDDGHSNSGSAYVFTRNGNSWSQQSKLTANDPVRQYAFGWSVSVDQNKAIVGARHSSSAYLFRANGSTWQQENKLTAGDGASGTSFGQAVSISGNRAIVGAPSYYDDIYRRNLGMAYAYNLAAGSVSDISVSPNNLVATVSNSQRTSLHTKQIVIKNTYGNQPLTWSMTGSENWLTAEPSSGSVPAGGQSTVSISFDSTNLTFGHYDTSLTITSNDPDEATVTVSLLVKVLDEYKLNASNASGNRRFGNKVALDGSIGVVGSSNQVYFYHKEGEHWEEKGPFTFNRGVSSVAIHGNVALIGAAGDNTTATNAGAVHVYQWNGTDWAEQTKLLASDGAANDQFGYSVAIHRNLIAIGAFGDDSAKGSVYLYRKNGSNWQYERTLTATDGEAQDRLGFAVSIYDSAADSNHDLIVAGAPNDDDNGRDGGAAYIFRRDLEGWEQASKLTITDVAYIRGNSNFGQSVAINQNLVAVGSKYDAIWYDPAYVYRWNGSTWAQEAKLSPIGGGTWNFAKSLSISGDDTLLVGDSGFSDGEPVTNDPWGTNGQGAAYIFKYEQGSWQQKKVILAGDGADADDFGTSVALSGDVALIGAPQNDDNGSNSGSAYIYDFSEGFGTPKLSLSHDYLEISLSEGERLTQTVTISNNGTGDLQWRIDPNEEWISELTTQITDNLVLPSRSTTLVFHVPYTDSRTLNAGIYEDTVVFTTNDPEQLSVEVPVKLIVGSGTISSVAPNTAVSNAGNVPIVIKGYHFQDDVSATLGSIQLLNVTRSPSDYSVIHAMVPVGSLSEGSYDLTVQSGTDTLTLADGFTVTAATTESQFLNMVYLACDSQLVSNCYRLLNNLEQAVHNNNNLRIAVFWDGLGNRTDGYYLIQPNNDPIGLASYNDSNRVLLGEIDSADPNTLIQFAGWAHSQYPGQHTFLSLVDHGSGWASDIHPTQLEDYQWNAPGQDVGTLFWDNQAGNVMSIELLADALQAIADKTDVVYLDASLMGSVEVMAELAPYANYIVSHENLAWAAYPYAQYFADIDNRDPASLAQHIASVQHTATTDEHPSQVSVLETANIDAILNALNSLVDALSDFIDENDPEELLIRRELIQSIVRDTAKVDENADFALNGLDDAIDLYHFAALLSGRAGIPDEAKTAADALIAAIDIAVDSDHNHTSNGSPWPIAGTAEWDMSNLHGLSLYFPMDNEWKRRFYNERALPRFAQQSSWDDFIQTWYTENGSRRETEVIPSESCDLSECPVAPMHLALQIQSLKLYDQPPGSLVWVPVKLHGATTSDDVRGIQVSLNSLDTQKLTPANDYTPRVGGLLPADSYIFSVATENGWDVVATDLISTEAISGTGTMLEVPFYSQLSLNECENIEFGQHLLTDSTAPNYINHQHLDARICNIPVPGPEKVNVEGHVEHERQYGETHAGIQISFNNDEGNLAGSARSNNEGEFGPFDVAEGTHKVRYYDNYYLAYEEEVTIEEQETPETSIILSPVTLCAGDMNNNGEINRRDRNVIEAGIIPVGFPNYDLNASGVTDVADLTILQQNIGKTGPNTQCVNEFMRRMDNLTLSMPDVAQQSASVTPQTPKSFAVSVPTDRTWEVTLSLKDVSGEIESVGTRLALPIGSTIDESSIKLLGDFAATGSFSDTQIVDNKLYLVMLPPEDKPVTQDTDVIRFTMNVPDAVTQPVITFEATNPQRLQNMWNVVVEPTEPISGNSTIYLPVLQR